MPPSDRSVKKSNSYLLTLFRRTKQSTAQKLTLSENDPATTIRGTMKTKGQSNRYRMVALDLDRTLLASNGTLADVQADYLRGLSQKGFLICLATGRAASGTFACAAKLQIPRLPIVCSNGSSGFFWSQGSSEKGSPIMEEQFHFPVPKPIVQRALKLSNKHGFCIQYYYKDSIYVNPKSAMHFNRIKKYSDTFGVRVDPVRDDFQEFLAQDQLPSKLVLLFDPKDNLKARNLIKEEFDSSEAHIVKGTSTWLLQILSASSNKGIGLKHMCAQVNVPLEEVIAVGDAYNDMEFLQMAGLGVAVKNADPGVKEIADVNLDFTNDEHGPMRMLQELDENGELIFQQIEERELNVATC